MLVWWSIGAGVHVEPHSHANEQIVWMLNGKMEFRLDTEQRVCGPGDVVVFRVGRSTKPGSAKRLR
jgi:quercetin dioxygenase-like cupin family protein